MTDVDVVFDRLNRAIVEGHHRSRRLRRWSEFIRERDGNRCVECHATRRLSAHHICRKTFLPEAELQTGNGITLCPDCHREVHRGFNGRPDLSQPMDAQGGEKIDLIERLYCILDKDAVERDVLRLEHYHLDDEVLAKFKLFQGFEPDTPFPGPPVRQAYLIWAQTSLMLRRALLDANGLPTFEGPVLPGEAYIQFEDGDATLVANPHWRQSN